MHRHKPGGEGKSPTPKLSAFYADRKGREKHQTASTARRAGHLAEEPDPPLRAVLLRLQRRRRRREAVLRVLLLLGAGPRGRRGAAAAQRLGDARAAKGEARGAAGAGAVCGEAARRARLCRLEALLDGRELRLEPAYFRSEGSEGMPFKVTDRWFVCTSFSWLSASRCSRLWMRSLRAMSLRSAMATSFLSPLFCSTSCRWMTVSCSRLRSRKAIFFCCARLLDVRSTLLYCSRVSSSEISSSTTCVG
jgi:hypothetical protein